MARYALSPEGAESLSSLSRKLIIEANLIMDSSKKLEREISGYADDLGLYSEAILAMASKSKNALVQCKQDIESLSFRLQIRSNKVAELCSGVSPSPSASGKAGVTPDSYSKTSVPERNRSESQRSPQEEVSRTIEFLPRTEQQTFTLENGNTLFNTPQITGTHLNYDQGYAVPDFKGTCGIVSCENIARLAGKDVTEADAVQLAIASNCCTKGSFSPGDNGGTSPENRRRILASMGIDSVVDWDLSIGHIANEVEAGKGVIASVEVSTFWPDHSDRGLHAVTLTSVERDPSGNPVAFYVCDSGYGGTHFARRVDVSDFAKSLSGKPLNVTSGSIR